jgi:hypothetical protein
MSRLSCPGCPVLAVLSLFRTMRSLDRDVVLVRRTIDLDVGNFEWGGDGKGEVSLRATWG